MAWQAAGLIAAALLALSVPASAQTSAEKLKTPQTEFSTLSPEERRVLGPIQHEWTGLPGYQQQRLINSARRYPQMQPIQKERFDTRIRGWAAMTPEQRKEARDTFQGLRRLPPAQQHELRERWLQRHRGGEESSEMPFQENPQKAQREQQQRDAAQQHDARTQSARDARQLQAPREATPRETREPATRRAYRPQPADNPASR
jgi:hypothetical protein